MNTKQRSIKVVFSCILLMLVLAAGCANMDNTGMRQQGTRENRQDRGLQIQGQNSRANNVDSRIQVANQAADQIVSINGVNQANVLVTQRNAYVAAVLDDGQSKLTSEVENQIANKVRATDANIQNVYVSTNPDFVERINGYINDVQEGRPVTGFVEQFNEMVEHIFPNPR